VKKGPTKKILQQAGKQTAEERREKKYPLLKTLMTDNSRHEHTLSSNWIRPQKEGEKRRNKKISLRGSFFFFF
jgi:hypothetical protein